MGRRWRYLPIEQDVPVGWFASVSPVNRGPVAQVCAGQRVFNAG
ncbi:hypothetical protein [Actinomadura pelletieri]|nr:hypothetical protein [Actinomadura pelletieri]